MIKLELEVNPELNDKLNEIKQKIRELKSLLDDLQYMNKVLLFPKSENEEHSEN